jgi:[acyl-carrier-protein] S-malonyltransferase
MHSLHGIISYFMSKKPTTILSAAIFPGQGSEYPGMAACVREGVILHDIFSRISEVAGKDILAAALGEEPADLTDVRVSQLALFGTSVCYWRLLAESERFHCLAGHSLGLYAALYASGSVSLEDCADIILKVQEAIEITSGNRKGLMASIVGLNAGEVERICSEIGSVYVSNVNSATQIVISGWEEQTREACRDAMKAGALGSRELPISFPLHSPLMQGVEDNISPSVALIAIREPSIPLLSHLDGNPLDAAGIFRVLCGQLTQKVLWRDTVKAIRQGGIKRFLEVGPSDVLSKLVRWIERDSEILRAEELVPCHSP